ncbi:MAG: serine/threonine protein kinase [Deltaproteobacteria bacterium]|nr:serine/threonine protein kinase [Deltaproteobacteria bacterium]
MIDPASERFGPYELLAHLASGGMGDVYLAREVLEGGVERAVALKRLRADTTDDPGRQRRFLEEARIVALLAHPQIVPLLAFGSERGERFLAFEFVDGVTLRELLAANPGKGAPPDLAAFVAARVFEALAYAHGARDLRGRPLRIVHRDVSSTNVMIRTDGAVKLLDFGIARSSRHQRETHVGGVVGKRAYASPEQRAGLEVDHRSDIFSAGVLLHELVTGARPADLARVSDRVPGDLRVIVARCLEPDRARRFESAGEALASLESYLHRSAEPATPLRLAALVCDWLPEGARSAAARRAARLGPDATRTLGSTTSAAGEAPSLVSEPTVTARDPSPRAIGRGRGLLALLLLAAVVGASVVVLLARPGHRAAGPPANDPIERPERAKVDGQRSPPAPPQLAARPEPAPAPSAPVQRDEGAQTPGGFGFLSIRTTPWSQVFLGQRRLGATPLGRVRLPAGRHVLTLVHDELRKRIVVTIRSGQETRVVERL